MLLLDDHIRALDQLLSDKGYNGYIMSNVGFPGKLRETIRSHIFQSYISNRDLNPIHLSTYTGWSNQEEPYVRCDFTINYDDKNGFNIKKMNIHFEDQYGNIRNAAVTPQGNHDIPSAEKANSIVAQNDRKGLNKMRL